VRDPCAIELKSGAIYCDKLRPNATLIRNNANCPLSKKRPGHVRNVEVGGSSPLTSTLLWIPQHLGWSTAVREVST
jgi:hypothetical protein